MDFRLKHIKSCKDTCISKEVLDSSAERTPGSLAAVYSACVCINLRLHGCKIGIKFLQFGIGALETLAQLYALAVSTAKVGSGHIAQILHIGVYALGNVGYVHFGLMQLVYGLKPILILLCVLLALTSQLIHLVCELNNLAAYLIKTYLDLATIEGYNNFC